MVFRVPLYLKAAHNLTAPSARVVVVSLVSLCIFTSPPTYAERRDFGTTYGKGSPMNYKPNDERSAMGSVASTSNASDVSLSQGGAGVEERFQGAITSEQMEELMTQPSLEPQAFNQTDWAKAQGDPLNQQGAVDGSVGEEGFDSLNTETSEGFISDNEYGDGTAGEKGQNKGDKEEDVPKDKMFTTENLAHGGKVDPRFNQKPGEKPNNGCGPNGCPSPGGPCGPGGCPSPGGGGGRGGGLLSKLGGGGGGLGGLAGLAGLAGQNQGSGSGGLGSTAGGTSALESEIAAKEERVAELERQAAAKEATKSAEATAQALALTPTVTPTITPTATGSVTPGDNVTPQPTVAATASVVPTAGATVAATATVAPSQGSAAQSSLFPPVKLNM